MSLVAALEETQDAAGSCRSGLYDDGPPSTRLPCVSSSALTEPETAEASSIEARCTDFVSTETAPDGNAGATSGSVSALEAAEVMGYRSGPLPSAASSAAHVPAAGADGDQAAVAALGYLEAM